MRTPPSKLVFIGANGAFRNFKGQLVKNPKIVQTVSMGSDPKKGASAPQPPIFIPGFIECM